jgi:DedD protein
MDSRAKQRLTGAIILVALFVLLVPELLPPPKDSAGIADADAEEGMRRYTIDLDAPASTGGQAAEPAVVLPPVTGSPAAGADGERAQPGEAAMPAPVETPRAQGAASTAANPGATQDAPKPAPAAAAPAAAPTPAAPTSAQTLPREDTRAPAATGAQPRSFVVQLGSFGQKENAEKLVRDMTARGFATFIAPITTNGRELYRVRVGPTRDRASAEALAAQLKRMGQSGSIVPIP